MLSNDVGASRGLAQHADMLVTDALKVLLAPSKLKYKIVNDHTIALMTFGTAAVHTESTDASGAAQSPSTTVNDGKQQEGSKSSWNRLHLAQVDQGKTSSDKSVRTADNNATAQGTGDLAEILVTAQKKTQRLQDVPVPVSVLSDDALAQQNKLSLSDYANTVPGLIVAPISVLLIRSMRRSGLTSTGSTRGCIRLSRSIASASKAPG